ncbi:MAG: aminotransferase class I/II-fold pyridoxal phosphate-dependent enzyme [Rhodospirillaceae bacterium]
MSRFDKLFADYLASLRGRRCQRTLRPMRPGAPGRVWCDGRELLNVSANDYLGLSRHKLLAERSQQWAAEWGCGAGASRLVCGTLELHKQVEERLARLKGTEAALVLGSGWQANAAILPALLDKEVLNGAEPLVYTDRLIHASIHQGCQAAGVRQIRFRHNDLGHLEELLKARHTQGGRPSRHFIITESVFSMDGDRADLAAFAGLAERFDAFLYVDEAHATGLFGPQGMGLACEIGVGKVDLMMGTFSKALGGFGAYVAGSRTLCELLANRCSGFVYATAPPPSVLGAMDAALELVPGMTAERVHLHSQAERFRKALQGVGIDTGDSNSQIIPAMIGQAAAALAAAQSLEDAGILGMAIRQPTVPDGSARIRFALSAVHSEADINRLIAVCTHILPGFAGAWRQP